MLPLVIVVKKVAELRPQLGGQQSARSTHEWRVHRCDHFFRDVQGGKHDRYFITGEQHFIWEANQRAVI